ncbi:MAG: leucine-rich repeat domain-containing protein [Eubacterium sp.]
MARININKQTVMNICGDDIVKALQQMIFTELEKPEKDIDTDFVDECVNALLEIEKDENKGFAVFVPLVSSEQFLQKITNPYTATWKNLNKTVKIAIVAAVLTGSTLSANAAVKAVTGVDIIEEIQIAAKDKLTDWGLIKPQGIDWIDGEDDDDEEATTAQETKPVETTTEVTTTTAMEDATNPPVIQVTETTTKKPPVIDWGDGEDDDDDETTTTQVQDNETTTVPPTETTTRKPLPPTTAPSIPDKGDDNPDIGEVYLVGVRADFDNFKTAYVYGEELTYEGLTLTKVFSDGTEEPLSLEECDYTKSLNMNVTANYTLRIIYDTCVVKINITVRPDDETRNAEACVNDEFSYLLTEDGAYITKYFGSDTSLNINYVDGHKVIAIASGVFENSNVESVIAENVERIYPNAFKGATALTECVTPMVKYIGDSAFEGCSALEDVSYGIDLYYFGKAAFKDSGITSITIPYLIKDIPESLCEGCESLKYVYADYNIFTVGAKAFNECFALELVEGTQYLKSAGEYAFYNDELVEFSQAPSYLESVGDGAFAYCKNIDFGSLDNLKELGMQSFFYCSGLTGVTLQEGITEIPYGAFRGAHITEIMIPEGVTKIGEYALMSTAIRSLDLPTTLQEVGTYGLYITTLREAYFGDSVTEMAPNALFRGSRLVVYVFENTAPLDYAIENNINYVIRQGETIDDDRIPWIDGEDD